MYEQLLEDIAQTSGLREVNPYIKIAVGIGSLGLCLISTSYIAPLFFAISLSAAVLILARIDPRLYAGLFFLPFWFAGVSVTAIVLISGGNEIFWSVQPFSWLTLSVTRESLNQGIFIFSRVLGGMAALCFIALTTPMTELFVVMRQCRVPEVVLDLAMMIYRSIFIMMDQLVQVYQAQVMRLGYSRSREAVRSFSTLCGAVFVASWETGEDLVRAMDARCYAGRFATLGETRPADLISIALTGTFLASGTMLVLLTRNIPAL